MSESQSSEGWDTALARLLDAEGTLGRAALVELLREVRAQRESGREVELARLIVARGLLPAGAVEDALRRSAQPRPPAAALPGQRFGAYRVLRRLGGGGMGEVFEVEHEQTRVRYALKATRGDASPEEAERFAREAQLLASLEHPHLVRVHSADLAGRHPYLVMQLCPGGSLADRLARGPLQPAEAQALARDLASALDYLHERGVLHRDLKPGNVLYDEEGRHRLSDFGLARARAELPLTRTGELLGTPGYMAPEQIEAPHRVDPRADVYGLGALLYAALSGRAPFRGGSALEVLDRVLREEPADLRELAPAAPAACARACARALTKDPARRPSSAGQLAREFCGAASGPARAGGSRGLVAALAGAALLALGGFWLVRPQRPSAAPIAPAPSAALSPSDWRGQVAALDSAGQALELLLARAEEWEPADQAAALAALQQLPPSASRLTRLCALRGAPQQLALCEQVRLRELQPALRLTHWGSSAELARVVELNLSLAEAMREVSDLRPPHEVRDRHLALVRALEPLASPRVGPCERFLADQSLRKLAQSVILLLTASRWGVMDDLDLDLAAASRGLGDLARRLPWRSPAVRAALAAHFATWPPAAYAHWEEARAVLAQGRRERGNDPGAQAVAYSQLRLALLVEADPALALARLTQHGDSRILTWARSHDHQLKDIANVRRIELVYRERLRLGRFDPEAVAELKGRLTAALTRSRGKEPVYPLAFFELLVNLPHDRLAMRRGLDRHQLRRGGGSEHVAARRLLAATRALVSSQRAAQLSALEQLEPPAEGARPEWAEFYGTRALLQWRLGRPRAEIADSVARARRDRAPPLGAPWTWPGYLERVLSGEAWWPGDKWPGHEGRGPK